MVRARKPRLENLPSTGYGDQAALEASDAAVPSDAPAAMAAGAAPGPFISPDEVPNLSDPSTRPGEPLTTGLPMGSGAGVEALGPQGSPDPTRQVLMAMLVAEPNNDVMRLLDMLDIQGR